MLAMLITQLVLAMRGLIANGALSHHHALLLHKLLAQIKACVIQVIIIALITVRSCNALEQLLLVAVIKARALPALRIRFARIMLA